METRRCGGCMGRMTDFTRQNPFARAKGQEAEKSRLFKHARIRYKRTAHLQSKPEKLSELESGT